MALLRPYRRLTFQPGGFTLIEVLVATALFLLVAVVVTQIVNSTARLTKLTSSKLDVDAEARQALDRMRFDLHRALLKPELPDRIEKEPGNDRLVFYTRTDGYEGDRGVAAVAYEVENFTLRRGVDGFFWMNNNSDPQLPFAGISRPADKTAFIEDRTGEAPNAATFPNVDSSDDEKFEALSPGVFRFEYCFLLRDGSLSTLPIMTPGGVTHNLAATTSPTASSDSSAGYTASSRWYRPANGVNASRTFVCTGGAAQNARWRRLGWNDVKALVVGIAVIDPALRQSFAVSNDQLSALAAAFPDAENGKDLLEAWADWRTVVEASDLPPPLIQSIRVHQRYIPLN